VTELERGELDALAARWRRAFVDDSFERCCTPDVSYEDPVALEPLEGLAALRAHAAALRAALPDVRVEGTAPALVGAHHACLPWRLVGTHRGEVSVLPASGRRLSLYGVHYVELVDGAVRRARGFFDLYEAAIQLGLLPARGGLGETALLLLRGFGVRRRSPT
jgi:steroid delta-isomerase-like uncharacterized protein